MATIRKRHNGYQVQVRRTGCKETSKTFANRQSAQQWAKTMEAQIFLNPEPASPPLALTLYDLLLRYREEIIVHKRSKEIESIIVGAIMRQSWTHKKLTLLGPVDFVRYRDSRLQAVKPATVCRELGLLSHAYSIAMTEWNLPITYNPLQKVRRPKIQNARERRLEQHEERILLQATRTSSAAYLYPVVVLALETAMRQGEILSIAWTNIDWNNRVLTLPLTKNGTMRRVPLTVKAVDLLRMHQLTQRESSWVFPVTQNALKKTWQRLTKRIGITDLRFHDLRHEATSRLFEKGLNVMEVASITGHKDVRMLHRYTHPRAEMLALKLS